MLARQRAGTNWAKQAEICWSTFSIRPLDVEPVLSVLAARTLAAKTEKPSAAILKARKVGKIRNCVFAWFSRIAMVAPTKQPLSNAIRCLTWLISLFYSKLTLLTLCARAFNSQPSNSVRGRELSFVTLLSLSSTAPEAKLPASRRLFLSVRQLFTWEAYACPIFADPEEITPRMEGVGNNTKPAKAVVT